MVSVSGEGQQVELTRDGIVLTVTGPVTAAVGDEVRLEAETNSGTDIIWIVPSGETTTGPGLELHARGLAPRSSLPPPVSRTTGPS